MFFLCELLELVVVAVIASSVAIMVVQGPIISVISGKGCRSVFFIVAVLLSVNLVVVNQLNVYLF